MRIVPDSDKDDTLQYPENDKLAFGFEEMKEYAKRYNSAVRAIILFEREDGIWTAEWESDEGPQANGMVAQGHTAEEAVTNLFLLSS